MNLPKAPFQVTLLRDETSIEAVCVGIHETSDERPALVCLQLESRSLTDPSFGNKWYIVNSRGERVEGRYTNFAQGMGGVNSADLTVTLPDDWFAV